MGILKDKWGISNIYAKTEHDLFFAQGYSAARDRLFQFEIWRAQTPGTTPEFLGPKALARDHGTRLFKYDCLTEYWQGGLHDWC